MRQRLGRRGTGEVFAKVGNCDRSPERSDEEKPREVEFCFTENRTFACQSPDFVLCLFYRAI